MAKTQEERRKKMDNEKMNGIELTDKDLEQVSGGQVVVKEKTDVKQLKSRVIASVGAFAPDIYRENDG